MIKWILSIIILFYSTFCYSAEMLTYEVTGMCRNNGNLVTGIIWANQVEPSILMGNLKIKETQEVISVIGSWSGYGMMELKDEKDFNMKYDVEVIE